ncbi:uroporphyrinogen-III synthase [Sphingomicrobium aquimarinum]|uniref:uroporphyrinogen-III synthase n=1 Tax=Sphingomicrobium aquimarinum TaxID=3133971 RepID=UPI003D74CF09
MNGDPATARPIFWVSRTEPDNANTATRLREMGLCALTVPVLKPRAIRTVWPHDNPDALVFTSAHGVRFHDFNRKMLELPVFTVGDRTARAAIAAGYRDVRSASGDVRALEHLVRQEIPVGRTVFHCSARQPAGDLVGNLKKAGYAARKILVYETRAVPIGELTAALVPLKSIDGILVHSPRGGRIVRHVIDGVPTDFAGSIYCISRVAAAPFAGLPDARIRIADRPDEDSMLRLFQHLSQ